MAGIEDTCEELRTKEQWAQARSCYEGLLDTTASPVDRAKVLANIMQMYKHEGNLKAAMETADAAMALVVSDESDASLEVRGYIRGYRNHLAGAPAWSAWLGPLALRIDYFFGAALGPVVIANVFGSGVLDPLSASIIGGIIAHVISPIRRFLPREVRFGQLGTAALAMGATVLLVMLGIGLVKTFGLLGIILLSLHCLVPTAVNRLLTMIFRPE